MELVVLGPDNLERVHRFSAESTFWEVDPLGEAYCSPTSEVDKSVWLAARAAAQGTVGLSIAEPGSTAGALATVLFCPAAEAPGAVRMPTAPASLDAWLLTSLHIDNAVRHRGWELILVEAAVAAASSAGAAAVEAFGVREGGEAGASAAALRRNAARIGLVAAETLEEAGLRVLKEHGAIPLLRLELPPERELLSARAAEALLACA